MSADRPASAPGAVEVLGVERNACEVCGSTDLRPVKCKVICGNCRTILQSCADL